MDKNAISLYKEVCSNVFADKINNRPRKILGYHTPEELFEQELDRIYRAA